MDTNPIIKSISSGIKSAIRNELLPLSLLRHALSDRQAPFFRLDKPFTYIGMDAACFGVYVDGRDGVLYAMLKRAEIETIEVSTASDFIRWCTNENADYEQIANEFLLHFLPDNIVLDELTTAVRNAVLRGIADSVPYADMVMAYRLVEVGNYHNSYYGQEYIEGCREIACHAE